MDDLVSFDPFIARCIRLWEGRTTGRARRARRAWHVPADRSTISWSWNLEGQPVGDSWYESKRTVHTGGRTA